MSSLENLSDKQNHILTQFSYCSSYLKDKYNRMTVEEIYKDLVKKFGSSENEEDQSMLKKMKAMASDSTLKNLIVKDVGDDSVSGFGAIAFEDSEGNVGITYRGTDGLSVDSLNDWGDNLEAMATGTSYQSVQAEAFYQKNADKNGNNYLYGHSKGGNLTQSVFVNHYNDIKKVHNLNPQPINPYSLTPDQIVALNSNKMDIVVTEGDYVWFLGGLAYDISHIRVMDNSCGDDAHGYSSKRYDSEGNLISGRQPLWEYLAYGGISTLLLGLQSTGSMFGFVYNTGVRVVDFVKNELIPAAKSLVNSLMDKVNEIGEKAKDFAQQVSKYFNDIINNVSNWWNKTFNPGNSYANNNPYININTTTMRTYASQLQSLSSRSKSLDRRMNSLYWQLGINWNSIINLARLLKAEVVLDYASRLDKCVNYLNQTASDFEQVEREIQNMVG